MTTVLFALTAFRPDGLDTKIDRLSVVARPLSEVASQLSVASGELILVSGALANEPVFISLNGRSVQEAMDQIAKATYADWSHKNDAWTLIQGNGAAEASAKQRAKRLASLKAVIDKRRAELQSAARGSDSAKRVVGEIDAARARFKDSFKVREGERPYVTIGGAAIHGPVQSVLAEALTAATPELLDSIPEGRRFVWSTRPNRLQRPLNANLGNAISQFVQATAAIFDEAAKSGNQDYGADWIGPLAYPKQRVVSVSKVNLSIQNVHGVYSAKVQLVGSNGEDLGSESATLAVAAEEPGGEEPQESKPIPLNPASREFVAFQGTTSGPQNSMSWAMRSGGGLVRLDSGQGPTAIRPSQALKPFLEQPAQSDFLGLATPEILTAELDGKEYVAILPDEAWSKIIAESADGKIDKAAVEKALDGEVERIDGGDVGIWRPLDPLSAQSKRVSRAQMQMLTGRVRAAGFGHVKDLAGYVANRGLTMGPLDPDATLFRVSMPYEYRTLTSGTAFDADLSVILAGGPDYAKGEFLAESPWLYSKMSGQQRAAFERMVLTRPDPFASMGVGSISIGVSTSPPGPDLAADNEPTERFQNGFPPDAGINFKVFIADGVLARMKGDPMGRLMSGEQLGALTGFIEGSGGANGDLRITEFEEYLPANVRNFEGEVSGGFGFDMTDGSVNPGARAVPYSQLPAELLKQGEAMRESVREAMKNIGPMRRGGDPPPKA